MHNPFARTQQCKACPWKKSTVPGRDIPGGYDGALHRQLTGCHGTGLLMGPVMACHETPPGAEQACVGWLANQLGPGNNIGLRLEAMRGRIGKLKLDGDQHETLEQMCATAGQAVQRKRRKRAADQ